MLIFPNTSLMAEFILNNRVSKVETNSNEKSVKGFLSEEQINTAIASYGADLRNRTYIT